MRKACKRYADEFFRYPKEHVGHTQSMCHRQKKKRAHVTAEEQEGDSDVETALAALAGASDIDLEEPTFKRYCWRTMSHDSCVENSG